MTMMMKSVSVCSVVLLAFVVDLSRATPSREEIDACFFSYYGDQATCDDSLNLVTCLKKIVTDDESTKQEIKDAIEFNENRVESCPGFKSTGKCLDSEIMKCKYIFYQKQLAGDKSICEDLQKVRECLVNRLNDSCVADVVSEELKELSDLAEDCKSGNDIGQGTCSFHAALKCSGPVYNDRLEKGDVVWEYTCKAGVVANANKCLSALATKCKTRNTYILFRDEKSILAKACPSTSE